MNLQRNADSFRESIIPGVPLEFQRTDIMVTVNPIGSVLMYQTVDRQRYQSLGDSNKNYETVARKSGSG
jgi:hypothetical protein